jgi:uncharacterized iron-regulated protein
LWEQLLIGSSAQKLIVLAAAVTAVAYLLGAFKPVIDSRLPTASQLDVRELKDDLENHVDTLKKGLDQTLEVAKAANQAAQQSLQQGNDFRLDRLLQQKVDLEGRLRANPADKTSQAALARTIIDIARQTGQTPLAPMP